MATADSAAAVQAAINAKRSTADWLGEAIREKLAREREPHEGEVIEAGRTVPALIDHAALPPLSIEDIGRAVEIAEKIATLRGRPRPRQRTLVRAGLLLEARLLAETLPGQSAAQPAVGTIDGAGSAALRTQMAELAHAADGGRAGGTEPGGQSETPPGHGNSPDSWQGQ